MRIVLDTNVVISALFFGGKPRQILQSVVKKDHIAVTSPILLSELAEVLRKKFGYSRTAVAAVDQRLRRQCSVVLPHETVNIAKDLPDNRVIEAAIEGECVVIVTGDVGLLSIRNYRNIHMMTPDEFLRTHSKS